MIARIKKSLDRILELMVALAMGVLVVDVAWQVFTRYVLGDSSSWTEELATFLMILGGSFRCKCCFESKGSPGC